jgi:hypothetical protein
MKNRKTVLMAILPILACIAPSPIAQATDLGGVLPGANNADGIGVLTNLTTGGFNTGTGWLSLASLTTGSFNTGVGAGTLVLNLGDLNTATGAGALLANDFGSRNTANGALSLSNNTTGVDNTAVGAYALFANVTGQANTATGSFALQNNNTGGINTAVGNAALAANTSGTGNTGIGVVALRNNTTGNNNIALGPFAGRDLTTGANNIDIGNLGIAGESNTLRIGTTGTQTATYVAGIFGATVTEGVPVIVDNQGHLGTAVSSARFKQDVQAMGQASKAILSLKPVTFCYTRDAKGKRQFGLIAEEVAKVNPDLVVNDRDGKPYTVRYDAVNAMLLNEFLKARKKAEELEATVARLEATAAKQQANGAEQQKQIAALAAAVKEQTSQIQKVAARGELDKTVQQMAINGSR